MAKRGSMLVGTVGQGVLRSVDDGETWVRASVTAGMHSDAVVRCLMPHPNGNVVFVGSDLGLYRSDDAGETWHLLDTAMNGRSVWSLALDSTQPDTVLAGTGTPSRAALFSSKDGGLNWQECSVQIAETCAAVGVPRPTAIALDPTDPANVWAGIEVDGVRRSRDGGVTWEKAAQEITNPDIHCVTVSSGPPKCVVVLTSDDVWLSQDDGANWTAVGARQAFPWHYPRCVAVRPDKPNTLFVTLGDSTPGRTGAIMRSDDMGKTWQSLELPGQPNSAMWTLTFDRSSPDRMLAASRYGNLFRSQDGGNSWSRVWREFSAVSSLALLPAA